MATCHWPLHLPIENSLGAALSLISVLFQVSSFCCVRLHFYHLLHEGRSYYFSFFAAHRQQDRLNTSIASHLYHDSPKNMVHMIFSTRECMTQYSCFRIETIISLKCFYGDIVLFPLVKRSALLPRNNEMLTNVHIYECIFVLCCVCVCVSE